MDGRGDELGRSLPVLLLIDEQSRAGDRAIAGLFACGARIRSDYDCSDIWHNDGKAGEWQRLLMNRRIGLHRRRHAEPG